MHRRVREWAESTCAEKPTYISSYVVDPSFPKDTLVLGGLFLLVHEPRDEPAPRFYGYLQCLQRKKILPLPLLVPVPLLLMAGFSRGQNASKSPQVGGLFQEGFVRVNKLPGTRTFSYGTHTDCVWSSHKSTHRLFRTVKKQAPKSIALPPDNFMYVFLFEILDFNAPSSAEGSDCKKIQGFEDEIPIRTIPETPPIER